MILRYRPAPDDDAAMHPDQVLLEQWTTVRGRPLELRVTAAGADIPNAVAVQVRYGSGQAEVVAVADDSGFEACEQASEAVETSACPFARTTAEREDSEAREEEDTTPRLVNAADCIVQVNVASVDGERHISAPTAASPTDPTLSCEDPQPQDGEATCVSGSTYSDPAPLLATSEDLAADTYTVYTTTSSPSPEREHSSFQAGNTLAEGVSEAVEPTITPSESGEEQEDSALPAEESLERSDKPTVECEDKEDGKSNVTETLPAQNVTGKGVPLAVKLSEATTSKAADITVSPVPAVKGDGQVVFSARSQSCHTMSSSEIFTTTTPKDRCSAKMVFFVGKVIIPEEVFQYILSLLNWQQVVGVRSVSQSWRQAVDIYLAQRTELHIGKFDPPAILDDSKLENLLRAMPALRGLSVEWRQDHRKLDVDIVSRHCRNLVELDLTRFRLDPWSLEKLCVACPELEVIKLPWNSDDSCAEVLLRKLPHLRSLDLAHTKVTGHFLCACHELLDKLSLASCSNLNIKHIHQALRTATTTSQTARWDKIRNLDMTSTSLSNSDLTEVLKYFPRLQRLSLSVSQGRIPSYRTSYGSNPLRGSLSHLALREHVCSLDILRSSLDASDLMAVLTQSPQLERLSLAHSSISGSSYLDGLDKGQPALRLREMNVTNVKGLAASNLAAILFSSPQLERLQASGSEDMCLTTCLKQLSGCPELRELDISNPRYNDHNRRAEIGPDALTALLSGCRKLERLMLVGCHISEASSLLQLVQCPELRELGLSWRTTHDRTTSSYESCELIWRPIDSANLGQGLSSCPLLERLTVGGLRAPLERVVPPSGLPNLTYLNVRYSGLTNNSLRRLPGLFPSLNTLIVQDNDRLREDGMMTYLPRLENLRSLELNKVKGVTTALRVKLKACQLTHMHL